MGTLLKFVILLYVLSLIFSLFVALITFIIDVFKWHDSEKKEEIISSKDRSVLSGRTGSYTGRRTGDIDNDNSTELHDNNNERSECHIQPIEF